MATKIDMSGTAYGMLTAVSSTSGGKWLFSCECGSTKEIAGYSVRKGITISCGCVMRVRGRENGASSAAKRVRHGACNSPEYKAWAMAIQRCCNPNDAQYPGYGGRGITFSDKWRCSFEAFLAAVGYRPGKGYDLDRRDNNKGYEPGNCRWVKHICNGRNTRSSKRWIINGIEFESKTHAAHVLGVGATTIQTWCEGRIRRGSRTPPKEGCYSEKVY